VGSSRLGNYDALDRRRWRAVAKRRYADNKQRLADYKAAHPCADCGWGSWSPDYHPSAMDLDHLPEHKKHLNVSDMMTHKWEHIANELAKCDVVCARCHRLRTQGRHVDGTQVLPGRARLEDRGVPTPTLFDEAGGVR